MFNNNNCYILCFMYVQYTFILNKNSDTKNVISDLMFVTSTKTLRINFGYINNVTYLLE